jgi:NAD kinase
MNRLTENKIILIVRKTRLDELIARFNTQDQASFYIKRQGADFSDYLLEDQRYKDCVSAAQRAISKIGRLQVVDRAYVHNFIFGEADTVVVLGQDGLVANVLKYLTTQLVLGVNPDPDRWEGVLLPFTVHQLGSVLPDVFDNKRQVRRVTMAKATLNTGQTLYGVNDLFIGPRSHTSARYSIEIGGRTERHSSSGVIVSTGLGSTGWLRSILAGAVGIASYLSGQQLEIRARTALEWDSRYLYFSVREPWPSKTSSANIAFGQITDDAPLGLVSYMPEDGVIFSDGIQDDYVQFNSGTCATISVAEKIGHLVV